MSHFEVRYTTVAHGRVEAITLTVLATNHADAVDVAGKLLEDFHLDSLNFDEPRVREI